MVKKYKKPALSNLEIIQNIGKIIFFFLQKQINCRMIDHIMNFENLKTCVDVLINQYNQISPTLFKPTIMWYKTSCAFLIVSHLYDKSWLEILKFFSLNSISWGVCDGYILYYRWGLVIVTYYVTTGLFKIFCLINSISLSSSNHHLLYNSQSIFVCTNFYSENKKKTLFLETWWNKNIKQRCWPKQMLLAQFLILWNS